MSDIDMERLEARINQILDRKLDALTTPVKHAGAASRADRTFWGVFLVLLGGLWLADRLGWIDIPAGWLWPVILIGFGLYLVLGGRQT